MKFRPYENCITVYEFSSYTPFGSQPFEDVQGILKQYKICIGNSGKISTITSRQFLGGESEKVQIQRWDGYEEAERLINELLLSNYKCTRNEIISVTS